MIDGVFLPSLFPMLSPKQTCHLGIIMAVYEICEQQNPSINPILKVNFLGQLWVTYSVPFADQEEFTMRAVHRTK